MSVASLRASAFALTLVAASVLAGCASGGGHSTLTPPPLIKTISYSAIGASDAAGYGASVTCNPSQNPVLVALPTCPGGTAYVPLIVKGLTNATTIVNLNNRGISGAVIGPDISALQIKYGNNCTGGASPGDFITNELPSVKGSDTLVTIFAGGNDTNAIVNAAVCQLETGALTEATVPAYLAAEVAAFGKDFETLTAAIHQKAPNAKIVVANLPNFANIPFANDPNIVGAKPLLQAVSVGIDTDVYQPAATSFGIPVVDLLCNPQSYVPANFFTDGFHPNDAGYALFAQLYLAQINAAKPTLPATSCSFMNVLGSTSITPQNLRTLPPFDVR